VDRYTLNLVKEFSMRTIKKILAILLCTGLTISLPISILADDSGKEYREDKVNVHTPIISPALILNDNRVPTTYTGGTPTEAAKNQLVAANDTSQSYNINFPGYTDPSTSGTYPEELRLDGWYFIHWQEITDLNWQGEENPADGTHRNTDTPDDGALGTHKAGGYAEETSLEDEFVKNKYMKFPFEVFYNGKFYQKNHWIKIMSPKEYDKDGNSHHYGQDHPSQGWNRTADPSVDSNTGMTRSDNHWKETPFYIPSWAREGLYKDISKSASLGNHSPSDYDKDGCLQLRVDAVNIEGRQKAEDTANASYNNIVVYNGQNMAAYTCIYNIPVELSGWVYDFTITGISDRELFGGTNLKEIGDTQIRVNNDYSFTANKQDKKTGLRNRLGGDVLRFAKDGEISRISGVPKWLQQNTIALHSAYKDTSGNTHVGKSNSFPSQGTLSKGTTFSFCFKTMSNLWDFGDGDHVEIIPSFKWVYYDKTSGEWKTVNQDNLKIYYSTDDKQFIAYGSEADRNLKYGISLSNEQFRQSFYDEKDTVADDKRYGNWVNWTIGQSPTPSMPSSQWLNRKNGYYTLSHIKLEEPLRLFSGEFDQMKFNIYNHGFNTGEPDYWTYPRLTNYSGQWSIGQCEPEIDDDNNYSDSTYDGANLEKLTRNSIQTWYGSYFVPGSLFVVDTNVNPKFKEDWSAGKTGSSLGLGGEYASKKFYDYIQYYMLKKLKEGGFNEDDPVFVKTGYLVINFDITVYKNNVPYMKYNGYNGGEWNTENYLKVINPKYPNPVDEPNIEPVPPTEFGDVAVVDMKKNIGQKYRAGIFNIN